MREYVSATLEPHALSVGEYWTDLAWGDGGHLEYNQDAARQALCDWIDGTEVWGWVCGCVCGRGC